MYTLYLLSSSAGVLTSLTPHAVFSFREGGKNYQKGPLSIWSSWKSGSRLKMNLWNGYSYVLELHQRTELSLSPHLDLQDVGNPQSTTAVRLNYQCSTFNTKWTINIDEQKQHYKLWENMVSLNKMVLQISYLSPLFWKQNRNVSLYTLL